MLETRKLFLGGGGCRGVATASAVRAAPGVFGGVAAAVEVAPVATAAGLDAMGLYFSQPSAALGLFTN